MKTVCRQGFVALCQQPLAGAWRGGGWGEETNKETSIQGQELNGCLYSWMQRSDRMASTWPSTDWMKPLTQSHPRPLGKNAKLSDLCQVWKNLWVEASPWFFLLWLSHLQKRQLDPDSDEQLCTSLKYETAQLFYNPAFFKRLQEERVYAFAPCLSSRDEKSSAQEQLVVLRAQSRRASIHLFSLFPWDKAGFLQVAFFLFKKSWQ